MKKMQNHINKFALSLVALIAIQGVCFSQRIISDSPNQQIILKSVELPKSWQYQLNYSTGEENLKKTVVFNLLTDIKSLYYNKSGTQIFITSGPPSKQKLLVVNAEKATIVEYSLAEIIRKYSLVKYTVMSGNRSERDREWHNDEWISSEGQTTALMCVGQKPDKQRALFVYIGQESKLIFRHSVVGGIEDVEIKGRKKESR